MVGWVGGSRGASVGGVNGRVGGWVARVGESSDHDERSLI